MELKMDRERCDVWMNSGMGSFFGKKDVNVKRTWRVMG